MTSSNKQGSTRPVSTQATTALLCAGVLALAGCQTAPPGSAAPAVMTMAVNGARLPYVEQGKGTPVLLVHGALSDLRTWARQREALSARYRAVAYTQRYFGTETWDMNGPKFGVQTHSDDLAAFIRGLNAGPVHLVGWSYGAQFVLNAVVSHPELVKSAFVFEPPVPTYVTDPAALKAIGDDAAAGIGPAAKAAGAGDFNTAARTMIDAVGERAGYFDAQPAEAQAIQLDSARTMRAQLIDAPRPPIITCAQLGQIGAPVAIVRGELVRPMLGEVADAAARCIPGKQHLIVPRQKHMWPSEDPQGFSQAVMEFLRDK